MSKNTFSRLIIFLLLFSPVAKSIGQSMAQRAINDTVFNWQSISSNNIRIYYAPDSYAEKHRMMLLRSIEKSVDEVLTMLEEPANGDWLHVYYLQSRDEMEQEIGVPVTGFAAWGINSIFLVVNSEWRSFEKHEFTHNVTMGRWGSPAASSRWMIEGIPVYVDGWCREYTVDEVASALLANNELPPLKELFENYADLGEIKAGFYAGSFIGFIHEKYGIEDVRNLWSEGTETIEEQLDSELNQIENMWKSYLKSNVDNYINVDLETIDKLGCG